MISLLGFMSWNDLCNVHLCSGRRNNVPETGLVMTGSFIEEINNLYKLSREVHTPYQSPATWRLLSIYRGTFFCMLTGCNPSKFFAFYAGFQQFTVKSNDFGAAAISMDYTMRRLICCIRSQMTSDQSSGYLVDIGYQISYPVFIRVTIYKYDK